MKKLLFTLSVVFTTFTYAQDTTIVVIEQEDPLIKSSRELYAAQAELNTLSDESAEALGEGLGAVLGAIDWDAIGERRRERLAAYDERGGVLPTDSKVVKLVKRQIGAFEIQWDNKFAKGKVRACKKLRKKINKLKTILEKVLEKEEKKREKIKIKQQQILNNN